MDEAPDEARKARRLRHEVAIRRELRHWHMPIACPHCSEWVGHRSPCPLIPLDVYLEEVRPGCVVVLRHWIGDAIRAACEKRGEKRP